MWIARRPPRARWAPWTRRCAPQGRPASRRTRSPALAADARGKGVFGSSGACRRRSGGWESTKGRTDTVTDVFATTSPLTLKTTSTSRMSRATASWAPRMIEPLIRPSPLPPANGSVFWPIVAVPPMMATGGAAWKEVVPLARASRSGVLGKEKVGLVMTNLTTAALRRTSGWETCTRELERNAGGPPTAPRSAHAASDESFSVPAHGVRWKGRGRCEAGRHAGGVPGSHDGAFCTDECHRGVHHLDVDETRQQASDLHS